MSFAPKALLGNSLGLRRPRMQEEGSACRVMHGDLLSIPKKRKTLTSLITQPSPSKKGAFGGRGLIICARAIERLIARAQTNEVPTQTCNTPQSVAFNQTWCRWTGSSKYMAFSFLNPNMYTLYKPGFHVISILPLDSLGRSRLGVFRGRRPKP